MLTNYQVCRKSTLGITLVETAGTFFHAAGGLHAG